VAWLGRRTFGPGAGFAAATFAALSGPHLAFSRMALTDASFLLAWLIALGLGMRFLERPGAVRAVAMGLGVGVAQQFKYNGWLAGAIVLGSAALGALVRPDERRAGGLVRSVGWGLVSAVVAWQVVLPWFLFVESHGGYSALLRHQRTYLEGYREWWPHLQIQADQAVALAGSRGLIAATLAIAGLSLTIGRPRLVPSTVHRWFAALASVALTVLLVDAPYWLGLVVAPWLLIRRNPAARLVGVWWGLLGVLTPFYHPYARLWLPFHAANWLLLGWFVPKAAEEVREWVEQHRASGTERLWTRLGAAYLIAAVAAGTALKAGTSRRAEIQAGLLEPSDSLRRATDRVVSIVPREVIGLRLLVRPAVTYYLAGRIGLIHTVSSEELLRTDRRALWALVDSAILRSESGTPSRGSSQALLSRLMKDWEVVEELPTTLSLPTVLDLDPGATRDSSASRSAPLWLLRPRRMSDPR
jgi:dolichyl-phosphate-mannose-protein mannosyltransferase